MWVSPRSRKAAAKVSGEPQRLGWACQREEGEERTPRTSPAHSSRAPAGVSSRTTGSSLLPVSVSGECCRSIVSLRSTSSDAVLRPPRPVRAVRAVVVSGLVLVNLRRDASSCRPGTGPVDVPSSSVATLVGLSSDLVCFRLFQQKGTVRSDAGTTGARPRSGP